MCAVGRKESRMFHGSHALLPCTAVRDLDGGQIYGRSGWQCAPESHGRIRPTGFPRMVVVMGYGSRINVSGEQSI